MKTDNTLEDRKKDRAYIIYNYACIKKFSIRKKQVQNRLRSQICFFFKNKQIMISAFKLTSVWLGRKIELIEGTIRKKKKDFIDIVPLRH
jgi:hypothetical protein